MAKNKRVAFHMEEEWHEALSGLAGTFGVSVEDLIRQSLPDVAVTDLFFQCKVFLPDLAWDEVADVGRIAVREHLRATYMRGLQEHLTRLGASLESSCDEVDAAKKRALDEMRADTAHPLADQLAKAQEDSIYLGCLYDAWKQAKAGAPGYTIAQTEIDGQTDRCGAVPPAARQMWAVLKDGKVV